MPQEPNITAGIIVGIIFFIVLIAGLCIASPKPVQKSNPDKEDAWMVAILFVFFASIFTVVIRYLFYP